MPGTLIVDNATFTSAIVMATAPKTKFNSTEQDVSKATGEKKWSASIAVSYAMDPSGIQSPAEVLNVGLLGEDPGPAFPPGTPVIFDQLRVGVMQPEQRERKDGNGMQVVGGKLYYAAKALKPAQPSWKKDAA